MLASGSVGVAESSTMDSVSTGMPTFEDGSLTDCESDEMAEDEDWSTGEPPLFCGSGDCD